MKKKYFDDNGHLIIRPYRLKDLAIIYDVSTRTVRRWIDEKLSKGVGHKSRKYFSIEQVMAIVAVLGMPQKICVVIPMQPLKKVS